MILMREVKPADLERLYKLAERLNTLNLPADRERLERIIQKSNDSFGGRYASLKDREYVFVMFDPRVDRLIGSCLIIAQHGTFARPSVYFQVRPQQMYSSTIERHFIHQTLQLTFDYDGPTEIGGLILDPEYRGHELKLGKLLSFVRFLYIGMHREWFRDEIVAELLPPLTEDGGSELWDYLGHHFTGLDYMTADRMSRENIEFIRALFPVTPLYTSLLPHRVSALIGEVGPKTKPVEKMLRDIGFAYNDHIDPFDGGPAFTVATGKCEPVTRTRREFFVGELAPDAPAHGRALIGYEYDDPEVRFRAAFVDYAQEYKGVRVRGEGLEKLLLEPGVPVGLLPLTGPDLRPLY